MRIPAIRPAKAERSKRSNGFVVAIQGGERWAVAGLAVGHVISSISGTIMGWPWHVAAAHQSNLMLISVLSIGFVFILFASTAFALRLKRKEQEEEEARRTRRRRRHQE